MLLNCCCPSLFFSHSKVVMSSPWCQVQWKWSGGRQDGLKCHLTDWFVLGNHYVLHEWNGQSKRGKVEGENEGRTLLFPVFDYHEEIRTALKTKFKTTFSLHSSLSLIIYQVAANSNLGRGSVFSLSFSSFGAASLTIRQKLAQTLRSGHCRLSCSTNILTESAPISQHCENHINLLIIDFDQFTLNWDYICEVVSQDFVSWLLECAPI